MACGLRSAAVPTVAVPECALLLTRTLLLPPLLAVFRQLNTAIAVSQMSSGQCRLAPLIQVIQDCSHLYHYTVKLMFKLHACEFPPPPLQPTGSLPRPPGSARGTQGCAWAA